MSVDFRTRFGPEPHDYDVAALFGDLLPQRITDYQAYIEPGASHLRLQPLTLEVDGRTWTWRRDGHRFMVDESAPGGAYLQLPSASVHALIADEITPMTLFTAGTFDLSMSTLAVLFDWWLVWRSAWDSRPIHVPGAVEMKARDGSALDVGRSFDVDDDSDEMQHFLEETGFLHIRHVFSPALMKAVADDMDSVRSRYHEGDGRSWWVELANGERHVSRMQGFAAESPAAAEALRDERLQRISRLSGDGHVHNPADQKTLEALVKRVGVVKGMSDVPWHKDCALGRHSYDCCSVTVGVAVTAADARRGYLAVVPGSHRVLVWPALTPPRDLPRRGLMTAPGDVSVHLSCTFHQSVPPVDCERRVMYVTAKLPSRSGTVCR